MAFGVVARAENIPASQLFMNVIKAHEKTVFTLTPLSGWGEIRFPASEQKEDVDNIILEGAFEQDMILVKYSEKAFLNTFAILDYTKDLEKFDWNNKAKLGVGISFNYAFSDKFAINLGGKYQWDYRSETERTLKGFMPFVNWFARWSLDSSSRYPGQTWGGASGTHRDNMELSGAILQGVDWYSFGTVIVNSFARFAYNLYTEDDGLFSNVTYGIGSQLKIPVNYTAAMQVGFRLNQNKMLKSGRTENKVSFFTNWYF